MGIAAFHPFYGWFVEPDQSDLPAMANQIRALGRGKLTRRANHF
jgi:hypothetical protein